MNFMQNELRPELLSVHAMNPFVGNCSSARQVMFSNHYSQALPIINSTEKRIQTGVERELGKYTFSIQMPEDGTVLDIIERYPRTIGMNNIASNPETVVIYQNEKNQVGCVVIPYYHSTHTSFGFKYVPNQEGISQLYIGNTIPKGTVFVDSPSKSEYGGYKYGIELNIAYMSHPAGAEDGVLICRDVLPKLKFKVFETRTIEFGSKYFPLNLYGNSEVYKPFPDIGETIRRDGILMSLRSFDNDIVPVTMSNIDLAEVDYVFDRSTYVRGEGGKVVDILMYHDPTKGTSIPSKMMEHSMKYNIALDNFYKRLLDIENKIKQNRKVKFNTDKVEFTPPLHRLLVEARAMVSSIHNKSNSKLNRVYKNEPIDDFMVTFVVEYDITPSIGFKLTGSSGDKGVICKIVEPEQMPVDAEGNRADVVMDAGSTINRMNVGRPYEMFMGSAARDITRQIRRTFVLPDGTNLDQVDPKTTRDTVAAIAKSNPDIVQNAHNKALSLYELVSPKQFQEYSSFQWNDIVEHVQDIVEDGIRLYIPIDNPLEPIDMIKKVNERFQLCYGPVTFKNDYGRVIKTKSPVRVGPYYMMVLEKIADDWSSVSYSKLHHFGILTPISKSEKYALPHRNSPIRTMGETESRLYSSYCGRECAIEMMDRNNNPSTHKAMVKALLESDTPSNIDNAVDRTKTSYGNAKPLQLISHLGFCFGWKFTYVPGNNVDYTLNHYKYNMGDLNYETNKG